MCVYMHTFLFNTEHLHVYHPLFAEMYANFSKHCAAGKPSICSQRYTFSQVSFSLKLYAQTQLLQHCTCTYVCIIIHLSLFTNFLFYFFVIGCVCWYIMRLSINRNFPKAYISQWCRSNQRL